MIYLLVKLVSIVNSNINTMKNSIYSRMSFEATSLCVLVCVTLISTSASMPASNERMGYPGYVNKIMSKRSAVELAMAAMAAPDVCLPTEDFHRSLENLINIEITRLQRCSRQQNSQNNIENNVNSEG